MFTAFFFGHRVVTASSPGMTTQNTPDSQITAVKKAVRFKRADHVMRTRRLETAGGRHQRGNRDLVKPYDQDKWEYGNSFQVQTPLLKCKCRSFFAVLELDSECGELVADLVGHRKILVRARFIPHSDQHIHEAFDFPGIVSRELFVLQP